MNLEIDPQLTEKIVQEVKSQGVFDAFRKDCMSDVDTKPAYQNLRLRVEDSVRKFLSEQEWTPELNKNQVRERMRRHIVESNFLDVGVERIVDQVVNPKIATVFKPKIEEISYNYLNIPMPPAAAQQPPPPPLHSILPPPPLPPPPDALTVNTKYNLLPTDLEQISPDSDAISVKSTKDEVVDMEIDSDDDGEYNNNPSDDEHESPPFEPLVKEQQDAEMQKYIEQYVKATGVATADQYSPVLSQMASAPLETNNQNITSKMTDYEKEASRSYDIGASQESQLSAVSSDTNISTTSNKNQSLETAATANISEEAQMPKFNENSNDVVDTAGASDLHFDIKKDEIKFEGTDRKTNLLNAEISMKNEEAFDLNGENSKVLQEAIKSMSIEENAKDVALPKLSKSVPLESITTNAAKPDLMIERFGSPLAKREMVAEPNEAELQNDGFGSLLDDSETGQLCIEERSRNEFNSESEQKAFTADVINEATNSNSRHSRNSSSAVQATQDMYHKDQIEMELPSPAFKSHSSSREKYHSSRKHSSGDNSHDRHRSHKSHCATESHDRSHDKRDSQNHRNRDRESNRNEYKRDDRKHSGSSSKQTTKEQSEKHNSNKDLKIGKSVFSIYSSSSSRSAETQPDEKQQPKQHNSTSSSHKKKSSSRYDDHHYEKKEKQQRRKSHDSSDGDKSHKNARSHKSSRSYVSSHSSKSKSKSTKSNGKADKEEREQKDVTQSTIQDNEVAAVNIVNEQSKDSKDEFGLDNLPISSIYLPMFAQIITKLTPKQSEVEKMQVDEEFAETHADSLSIDCEPERMLANSNSVHLKTPPKQLTAHRLSNCSSKPSPTPSDVSVNSKENERHDKNKVDSEAKPVVKRAQLNSNSSKCSQQRYNSEDLYKPRPILSQRSRRHRNNSNN